MSTEIKRRRGTTAQHETFVGALAELTVDTDKNTVVVHDGATAGGHPLAPESLVPGGTEGQILAIGASGVRQWVDNVGYDAGTWVPYISFGAVANVGGTDGQVYEQQFGAYIRIGNLVWVRFRVDFTNKGTSTGDAQLQGLPIDILDGAMGGVMDMGYYAGMALPGPGISGFPSGGPSLTLRSQGTVGVSTLSDAHFTNNSTLIGGAVYEAAP